MSKRMKETHWLMAACGRLRVAEEACLGAARVFKMHVHPEWKEQAAALACLIGTMADAVSWQVQEWDGEERVRPPSQEGTP